jgi:hypothetical protein
MDSPDLVFMRGTLKMMVVPEPGWVDKSNAPPML